MLAPLMAGLIWMHRHDAPGRWRLSLGLAGAAGLFVYLGAIALSWSALFQHSFVELLNYPSRWTGTITLAKYLEVVTQALPLVLSPRVIFFLAAGCGLALWPGAGFTVRRWFGAVAVFSMVAHYLIFPLHDYGFERMFLSSYFMIGAAFVMHLQRYTEAKLKDHRRPASAVQRGATGTATATATATSLP